MEQIKALFVPLDAAVTSKSSYMQNRVSARHEVPTNGPVKSFLPP